MLLRESKIWLLKSITTRFLLMAAALAVNPQMRATSAQKLDVYPPFTLVMQRTDFDAKGEVLSTHVLTRYYSASGHWRSVGNSGGYQMATVYRHGRGVYTSNSRTGVSIRSSDHAPGCALRNAAQLRSDPKFARIESLLGFEAYVLTERDPVGYSSETFFIPELGGGTPLKRIYFFDDGRRIIEEPLSITRGEPSPSDISGPDYRLIDQLPIFDKELARKIVSKPDPFYSPEAQVRRISGVVTVSVVVDESGRVLFAGSNTRQPFLVEAAVEAAYQAWFLPTTVDGRPVLARGVITYQFVLPQP